MLGLALAVWVGTRVAYAAFTYFHVSFFPTPAVPLCGTGPGCFAPGLVGRWVHWDSGWFQTIALQGYWSPGITGFYPLYPLLIKAATLLGGGAHVREEALVIANLADLAALWGVALLARRELGERAPVAAALAVVAYPFAYFLVAGYSESVFLALAVFAIYFARERLWAAAAAAAALASLTRPLGLALFLPLVWEWARQARGGPLTVRALGSGFLAAAAVPAGTGVWLGYCWWRWGQPLAPLHSEALWNRHPAAPWSALHLAFAALVAAPRYSYTQGILVADLGCVLLLLVVTLVAARRLPVALTLFSLGVLAISVSGVEPAGDPIPSAGRYALVAFPPLMALGAWGARLPWLQASWLIGGTLAQAALLTQFMAWNWTG